MCGEAAKSQMGTFLLWRPSHFSGDENVEGASKKTRQAVSLGSRVVGADASVVVCRIISRKTEVCAVQGHILKCGGTCMWIQGRVPAVKTLVHAPFLALIG